jgi:hypothetical protein
MTMPEGAQLSEDGNWWWDGSDWKPVAGGEGDGGSDKPSAEFIFDTNGVWVEPDSTDNPDNHVILHHDAGTQVNFIVWNVGAGAGSATVTVYVDDQEVQTWMSGEVEPRGSAGVDGDGFVHSCGRYPAGRHVFRVVVTPGHSGGGDSTTNEVDIE